MIQFLCEKNRYGAVVVNVDESCKNQVLTFHALKRLNLAELIVINVLKSEEIGIVDYFDFIFLRPQSSMDGLFRYFIHLWKDWKLVNGSKFAQLQIVQLISAFEMLKVNGKLLYLVNSLNPVEGENVIEFVLDYLKDQISIIKLEIKSEPIFSDNFEILEGFVNS